LNYTRYEILRAPSLEARQAGAIQMLAIK